LYGRTATGNPVEAINWRVVASAPSPILPLDRLAASSQISDTATAQKRVRAVYLPRIREKREVPVLDRYLLGRGVRFDGPAIIEERESTTVIGERALVVIDELLNLIVEWRD
jgi:N-methylhydantoinase A